MKVVKVRKEHDCYTCKAPIPRGTKAKVLTESFGRVSGSGAYFETSYFHLNCKITREGFLEQ